MFTSCIFLFLFLRISQYYEIDKTNSKIYQGGQIIPSPLPKPFRSLSKASSSLDLSFPLTSQRSLLLLPSPFLFSLHMRTIETTSAPPSWLPLCPQLPVRLLLPSLLFQFYFVLVPWCFLSQILAFFFYFIFCFYFLRSTQDSLHLVLFTW